MATNTNVDASDSMIGGNCRTLCCPARGGVEPVLLIYHPPEV